MLGPPELGPALPSRSYEANRGPIATERQETLLLLQRRPLGERDDIVVCIGQDSGRFSAVVKGSRAPRSRVGGLLEAPVELEARIRSGRSLDMLTQPKLCWGFVGIKRDLDRLMTAGFLARLFLACLPDHDRLDGAYALLRGLYEELERGRPVVMVALHGQDCLLSELGLAPHLGSCLGCGQEEVAGFSAAEGGVLCSGCYSGSGFALSPQAHLALLQIRAGAAEALSPGLVRQLGRVYKEHFLYHLGVHEKLFRRVLPPRKGAS